MEGRTAPKHDYFPFPLEISKFCLIIEAKYITPGTSPEVQWLKLHTSTARSMGLIPSWGTKILHAMQQAEKKKRIKKENPVKFKPPEELQTVTVFGVKAFTEEIQAK